MRSFVDSTPLLGQSEALHRRAQEEGYLFFRKLLPEEHVLEVRRDICGVLQQHGWLDSGTDPMDAITTQQPVIEGQEEFEPVYDDVQKTESFHALAHEPAIIQVLDAVFQEPTLPHPRNIARLIFPQATKFSTPPHQDYIFIQGTPHVWTAWTPLGDCPQELGVLAIMPGTQKELLPVEPMLGAGGHGIADRHLQGEWHCQGLACGDVLMFHSMVVHRGLHNVTENKMRLSVDYRYQGQSQEICVESLEPHHGHLKWPEVYHGWKSKQFQYYWRDVDLNLVKFNRGLFERDLQQGKPVALAGRGGY